MSNEEPKRFYTITEFKKLINSLEEDLNVVENPHTKKLFMSIGSKNFKCQQTFTNKKPYKVIVPLDADGNEMFSEACLSNVKESANNIKFTL